MMTSQLRKRLMEQMNADPQARQWAVLSKCGAGLAIVVLVAFIGISTTEQRDDVAQARQSTQSASATQAHRREVYERRRTAFEQSQSGQLARQTPAQNASSVLLE